MLFFKFTGNGDKQIADGQMLRTDPFALAASDAVTCFSVGQGQNVAVIIIRIPIAESLLRVEVGEHIRDQNLLRAGTFLNTVAARCARNHVHGIEHTADLFQSILFGFIERNEVLHEGNIVFHLFQIAHT